MFIHIKKPIAVYAVKWDGENKIEVSEFCNHRCFFNSSKVKLDNTEFGIINVNVGDFIIKGIDGEFYPCNSETFYNIYVNIDINTED